MLARLQNESLERLSISQEVVTIWIKSVLNRDMTQLRGKLGIKVESYGTICNNMHQKSTCPNPCVLMNMTRLSSLHTWEGSVYKHIFLKTAKTLFMPAILIL